MTTTRKRQVEIDRENGYKICSSCYVKKDINQFSFQKKVNRYKPHCKKCHNIKNKLYYILKPKTKQVEIDKGNRFKKCTKCHTQKNLDEFHFSIKRNYYLPTCQICTKLNKKKYYTPRPKNTKPKQIDIDENNGWKICTKCNKKKLLNKFYIKKLNSGIHIFNAQCKLCINKKGKRYNKDNKEKLSLQRKLYRQNNIELIKKRKYLYNQKPETKKRLNKKMRNKRKNDINYRILTNIRGQMTRLITKNGKCDRTIKLLGVSIDNFKRLKSALSPTRIFSIS